MTKAATNLNKSSSRAHTVFTLTYTYKKFDERKQPIDIKRAQINLIDLAGSERVAKTGCVVAFCMLKYLSEVCAFVHFNDVHIHELLLRG